MIGRKLTTEEVEALETKKAKASGGMRKRMAELYDSLVAEYVAGEYGEVTLGVGETKQTVRKHLASAFDRRGLGLKFRRGKSDTLKFQVVEPVVEVVAPVVATPTKKRSRKATATA